MFISLKLMISMISNFCSPKVDDISDVIQKMIISDFYHSKVDDVSMFIPKVDEF